jgi:RimJ/RimL family protein N-acetyltransferase
MNKKQTMINGKNIRLRTLVKTDLQNRVRWFNNPKVNQFLILNEKFSINKTRQWFQKAKDDPGRKDFIIETKSGIPIGCIGFRQINRINRSACFYIIIGEKTFWDKGIGTESTKLLFKWGFERLKLNKIWSNIRADNKKSIRLLIKVGFAREGLLREEALIRGRKEDIIRFGLLEKEFKNF